MVATLQRFAVRFELVVVEAIAREFGCTPGAIRRDVRFVASNAEFREKLGALMMAN